ncbi:MAG: 2-C-methyl-D-erythritol 2 4-cyclodiphosphate synthase [Fusobacteria bacterium]|nr:MAG: 2-C-methyl-D-erythritol 2 4-cyclodiphosphate synthase [Fusobacteriota bacterium]KAF0227926.1 MAG: 2-C-methyl-D-erythritol 2 4-cyclodiphosphate [Fusobacteriota bacterium]
MRIGIGYDVHKLIKDRPLILGGVKVPFELGLLGHSDADVLVHALMDAMLGALALGDIGQHFPDNDDTYKGADSLKLLTRVNDIIKGKNFEIVNIDSIIIAQEPKLKDYLPEMIKNICDVLDLNIEQVSIKATTEEYLGFTGNLEGIKSQVVVLLEERKS